MEKFKFETQGTNTFLVCNLTGEDIDTVSLGMITNNKIPGFAPAFYTQQDEEMLIKYNVSSHVSLSKFFSGTVTKKSLLGVLSGIVTAINSAEEYMLDLHSILLDSDYIFTDTGNSAKLICVPILDMPEQTHDYRAFFKQILFSTQFDQTEDCGYVMRIINHLNRTGTFSIEEFDRLLRELKNMTSYPGENGNSMLYQTREGTVILRKTERKAVQAPKPEPLREEPTGSADTAKEPETAPASSKNMSLFYLMQHYSKENAAQYKEQKAALKQAQKDEKQKKKKDKKEKVKKAAKTPLAMAVPDSLPSKQPGMEIPGNAKSVEPKLQKAEAPQKKEISYQKQNIEDLEKEVCLIAEDDEEKTAVLPQMAQFDPSARPYLRRAKNGEKILLKRQVFWIGKDGSSVDYFVSDNSAVSRSHAKFVIKGKDCYILDNNSTNHTYINGKMISENVEIKLKDGDTICLADEEFQFNIG